MSKSSLIEVRVLKPSMATQVILPSFEAGKDSLWHQIHQLIAASPDCVLGWFWKDDFYNKHGGFRNQHGNGERVYAKKVLLVKRGEELYFFPANDSGETFGSPQLFV